MHVSAVDLYESLSMAPDDRTRARIIAKAFDELESRYPNLGEMVTERALSETEMRLQLEIERVRADLSKDIEQVRANLSRDIEKIRGELGKEIKQTHVKIEQTKVDLLKWSFAFWVTNFAAVLIIIWRIFS